MKPLLLLFSSFVSATLLVFVAGCSRSSPEPKPALSAEEKSKAETPVYFLKLVPYAEKDALRGYFSLANVYTNQVAADGKLKLEVFTSTGISIGENSSGGVRMRTLLYENTIPISATNFQWETMGALLRVEDLTCRFVIPYEHFQRPFTRGKLATLQVTFYPEGTSTALTHSRNVSLY
jgi:hypothetical protein